MSPVRIHRNFPFAIRRGEMTRVLGYGGAEIPRRVEEMIEQMVSLGEGMVKPSCSYRLLERGDLPADSHLAGKERVYLCLVTIGGALERKVEQMKGEGDLARALVLDAYGSAAAEACADAAEAMIEAETGWTFDPRFSPGYGSWGLEEQRWILEVLEAEKLGVSLTEGLMMVPRKSVTFALAEVPPGRERSDATNCRVCGMKNCHFRHQ